MVLLVLYFWVRGDMFKVAIVAFIAAFVKYEAWFLCGVLFLASIYLRRFNVKTLAAFVLAMLIPVAIWSLWSWSLSGNLIAWYAHQVEALVWDVNFLGRSMSPLNWLHYPALILVMTAGIFLVGVIVALKQDWAAKTIMALALAYLAFRSWGYAQGGRYPTNDSLHR